MRFLRSVLAVALMTLLLAVPAATLPAQQALPIEGNEADLIAVLQSEAPLFDKAKACQRLAVIGTKASVPILAELLSDEQMAHYARYALEPMPEPAVDEVFRVALNKLDGNLRIGVINSIGVRGDAKAVDQLRGMLGNANVEVSAAAAAALGRIATPGAVEALRDALGRSEPLRSAAAGACLTAADSMLAAGKAAEAASLCDTLRKAEIPKHLQMSALACLIRARGADALPLLAECLQSEDQALFRVGLQMAHKLGGADVARLVVEQVELPEAEQDAAAPHPRQVLLISTLGYLEQKETLPVVLKAAQSAAADIRQAAITVLGRLGDASAVPVLLEAAVDASVSEAARQSLAELQGEGVESAIAQELARAEGPKRVVLVELAGDRGIAALVPALKEAAAADDPQLAKAAIGSLGATIGLDDLPVLIERLVQPDSPELAAATKEALAMALLRMPDRNAAAAKLLAAMPQATAAAQVDLLELLGTVGGEKALAGVAEVARTGSDELQDAATRVLGEWMSPDVAGVLLDLARSGPAKYQVRCLRGYIRVFRQLGLPDEQKLDMAAKAFEAATRDDERRLVLDAITRIPDPKALNMVMEQVANPGLKQAASKAAVALAERIVAGHPGAVADAMEKVLAAGPDDETTAKAKRWRNEAKKRM